MYSLACWLICRMNSSITALLHMQRIPDCICSATLETPEAVDQVYRQQLRSPAWRTRKTGSSEWKTRFGMLSATCAPKRAPTDPPT